MRLNVSVLYQFLWHAGVHLHTPSMYTYITPGRFSNTLLYGDAFKIRYSVLDQSFLQMAYVFISPSGSSYPLRHSAVKSFIHVWKCVCVHGRLNMCLSPKQPWQFWQCLLDMRAHIWINLGYLIRTGGDSIKKYPQIRILNIGTVSIRGSASCLPSKTTQFPRLVNAHGGLEI